MPKPIVHYFDARGRAEMIRLVLAASGHEFEDKRYSQEEFAKIKADLPTGQLPVLEFEGKKYPQSIAITRHLATLFKLTGKDETERFKCDIIVDCIGDVFMKYAAFHFMLKGPPAEIAKKKFIEEDLPHFITLINKGCGENGHLVGDSLTWADIILFDFLTTMKLKGLAQAMKAAGKTPESDKVHKVMEAVGAQEGIKAWVAKRPQTDN